MEFKTFLVKTNSSPAINIAIVGFISVLISIFFWAFDDLQDIALIFTFLGILLVLIGLITNKGKGLSEIDNQMMRIIDTGIEIKSQVYSFSDIKELKFFFHSFYSQSPYGYYFENAGMIEDGMSNTIHFISGNATIKEQFCLADMEHANMFFQTLNLLKSRGVILELEFRPFKRYA